MSKFIGSGFVLDVPEKCQDASCYTFVLPSEKNFAPYLTIKFEKAMDDVNLSEYADKHEALIEPNVENFKRLEKVVGKQQGRDAVVSLVEWGDGAGKIRQRFIYLHNKQPEYDRIYTITGTDLASNFKNSLPAINQIIKSFAFVDNQIFDL